MLAPTLTDHEAFLLAISKLGPESRPAIELYADGACSGNPGPGGWGAILCFEQSEYDFFGGELQTTNNRMEMMAAIQGLEILPRPCHVDIYTDSQYLRDGMTSWMSKWKQNGWMTASKQPVKNKDLWEELDKLMGVHKINWHWIKGHAGHRLNERADSLARHAIVQQSMAQK